MHRTELRKRFQLPSRTVGYGQLPPRLPEPSLASNTEAEALVAPNFKSAAPVSCTWHATTRLIDTRTHSFACASVRMFCVIARI